jgi:spore coat polysaccharide biosynthesis protein SpsF (cytidylyltransferase family)
MEITADSSKLKEIFKQAIIEAIEEKKDLVHDLLVDAMEDLAMIHAIQEGEKTQRLSTGMRCLVSWQERHENSVYQKLCQGSEKTRQG